MCCRFDSDLRRLAPFLCLIALMIVPTGAAEPPAAPATAPAADAAPATDRDEAPVPPAESPASESAPPATQPPAPQLPAGPPPDYTRLVEPAVADELELTDPQRSQIVQLLQQRSEAQANPDQDQRDQRRAAIDEKLATVLTPEQAQRFQTLPGQAKLRFNFREQNWLDVLDWFARQADLSLVVNEPPPGAFTYSDTKSYSPNEALDLLNGVLSTRGFTLIRRERMLICADVSKGFPEGLIPQVQLEDLDNYGDFELVQVAFPLGERPPQAVNDEVTPLLLPQGRATILPQSKQLLVTARAGKMRVVSAVIASIPEPRKEKPPEPKPPEPKPELAIYPVESLDLQATVETLESLVGGAKITIDQQAGQLNVYATPDQQAAIKRYLDEMAAPVSQERQARLEVYALESAATEDYLEQLKGLVPDAAIAADTNPPRIAVFARPDQHKKLEELLGKPLTDELETGERRAEVYKLQVATPAEVAGVIKSLMPRAEVATDAAGGRVVVVASPAQHALLQRMLQQFDTSPSADSQLESYPLPDRATDELQSILKVFVPKATIQLQTDPRRLMVIASVNDQQTVKRLLEQLKLQFTAEPRQLKFYDVPAALRARFTTLKDQLVPELKNVQIVDGDRPDRLGLVATEAEHARAAGFFEELRGELPVEELQLRVYSVTAEQRRHFVATYQQLDPGLKTITIQESQRPNELHVLGRQDQQLRVAKLLEQLKLQFPDAPRQIKFYDVPAALRARFTTLKDQLAPELKEVQIVDGDRPDRMGLVATEAEHLRAEDLLRQLRGDLPVEESHLRVYPVTPAQRKRFLALLPSLQAELPGVRLVETSLPTELTLWARPVQHERLATVLQSIADRDTAAALQLVAYPVEQGDVKSIQTVLQELYPDTKIVADAESSRVMVWTTPTEHAQIEQAVRQLDAPAAAGKNKMVYYQLGEISASDVVAMFQKLTPDMSLTADKDSNSIIAWGSEKDHQKLAKTVDDFRQQAGDGRRTIVSYPFGNRTTTQIEALLAELVPKARLAGDTARRAILAWATPEEHALIQQAMLKLSGGEAGDAGELRVYTITRIPAADAVAALQQIAPLALVSVASDKRQIMVWADAATHDVIRAAVERIEAGDPDGHQGSLQVYPGRPEILTRLKALLTQVAPQAQPLADTQTDRLMVWALPHEHKAIQDSLLSLESQLQPVELKLATYTLQRASASEAQQLLLTVVPDLKLLTSADPKQLLIRARPEDHKLIQQTLDELEAALSQPQPTEVKVYPLGKTPPATLTSLLEPKLTAGLTLIPDVERKALIVRASAAQHDALKTAIDELLARLPEAPERTSKVYRFQHADPASARLTLLQLLPTSGFAVDLATQSLMATALPEDHERIQLMVQQLDQPPETGRDTVVYRLHQGNVTALLTTLQSLLPKAVLGADPTSRTLVATATAQEHEQIRKAVQQMDDPSFSAMETKVYRLQIAELYSLRYALRSLSPEAIIVTDEENGLLVATATPADQKKIEAVVTQLNDPAATQKETKVYRLQTGELYGVRQALRAMLPRASISIDDANRAMLITGSAEDHAKIQQVLAELDSPEADTRETKVYRFRFGDVEAAQTALTSLLPQAVIAADEGTRALVATAAKADHLRIEAAVKQLDVAREDPTETRVYNFQLGDVEAAQTVLESLLPDAVFAVDPDNKLLVATASPAEHERIQVTVKELDRPNAEKPSLQAYQVNKANFESVYNALDEMYRRDQDVNVAPDPENQTILVKAPPEEHRTIAQLVSQMENNPTPGLRRRLTVYPLKGKADKSLLTALQELFASQQPAVELSLDLASNQVLAVATEKQHELIRGAVEQMQGGATIMEVFPLHTMDPFYAELAIDRLFADEAVPPLANGDADTQQLVVRGTREQLDQIRQLLIKMGELPAGSAQTSDGLRVVPFRGDVQDALEQIQAVWPRLRGNPLRVIQPPRILAPLPAHPPTDNPNPAAPQNPAPPQDAPLQDAPPPAPPAQPEKDQSAGHRDYLTMPVAARAQETPPAPAPTPTADSGAAAPPTPEPAPPPVPAAAAPADPPASAPEPAASPTDSQAASPAPINPAPPAEPAPTPAAEPLPSVVLIPGDGSITVMSQDAEALSQVESLLRTLSRQSSLDTGGGKLTIYPLKNAAASEVAEMLEKLFEKMPLSRRGTLSRVSVVADERLNAVVVHGRPADRTLISEMLQILDSDDVPNLLLNGPPLIVPVLHTDASRVLTILEGVYASQMKSGGTRPRITIPRGIPAELSVMLQQANAAAAGPLLTLQVDQVTNSIVILAPNKLGQEVALLVKELDQKAEQEDARRIGIVPLKSANVEQLEDALQRLLRGRRSWSRPQ